MGRLRTLTILMGCVAWGAAVGAAQDGTPPPGQGPAQAGRPPAPAPPVEYLRAGAMLFNSGQYELAAKYLQAAHDYRDQLSPAEQGRLDEYHQAMAIVSGQAPAEMAPMPADAMAPMPADPAATGDMAGMPAADRDRAVELVRQARTAEAEGRPEEAEHLARQAAAMGGPFGPGADAPEAVLGDDGRETATDDKSAARWLLLSAREDITSGQYDVAQEKIDRARGIDVRWRLFDEVTPNKLQKELDAARPAELAATGAGTAPPADPRERKDVAKDRLAEARDAIARGDYARAEAIAAEVEHWDLRFGFFEDSPAKVASAARALRHREGLRGDPSRQNDQSTYDLLVRESRALMGQGRLVEAEDKARHALQLNVVPPIDADRAEAVLHDIELARTGPQRLAPAADAAPAELPPGMPVDAMTADSGSPLGTPGPARPATDPDVLAAQDLGGELPPAFEGMDPAVADAGPMPADAAEAGVATAEVPAFDAMPEPIGEPAPAPADDPAAVALEQARSLYAGGNYAAARQAAESAVAAGGGVEAEDLRAQIGLAEQAAALKLYEAATTAVRDEDYERARALLNEVASMDQSTLDATLAQRVQDLLVKLPSAAAAAPAAALDASLDAQTIEAQRLNAQVGSKVAEARRLMESEPDQAIALLEETKAAVAAADLSSPVARTMIRRLEVAIELAERDRVAVEAKMADKEAQADAERTKLRIMEADIAKQAQKKELMDRAVAAQNDGDYAAAEAYAQRVVRIDPNDVTAAAMVTLMQTKRHFEEDLDIRAAKEEGFLTAMQDVDRISVVDGAALTNGISYPKNFLEMTRDRGRYAEVEPYRTPETMAVEKQLNEPISINMPEGTLGEALDYLRNYSGLNVVSDIRALQDEALTLEAPVNLVLQDVKVKTVLKLMLEPHGLSYDIRDGVLIITTPQSRSETITRVYQVSDLVVMPDSSNPLDDALPDPMGRARAGQQRAIDGAIVPAGFDPAAGDTGGTRIIQKRAPADFGPLITLITTSVAPGTWSVEDPDTGTATPAGFGLGGGFGGGDGGLDDEAPPIGSITPFYLSLSLIIRHTAEVHDDVVDLLRQLRRLQDLQVSVEVRFITVNDNFFEFMGVDFDFSIQSDAFGPKSSFVQPNPAAVPIAPGLGGSSGGGTTGGGTNSTTTAPYLLNPIRDHAYGQQPLTLGVGFPGATGIGRLSNDLQIPMLQDSYTPARGLTNIVPGAGSTFGIAFLSDLEVYLFLEALQGNSRSNIVQAPKVTTFNGASASIINQTTRYLVTSLTPIVSAGAIAFTPNISPIPDGVQLQVTPVVTADRRYVRMSLSPRFFAVQGVDSFSFGGGAVGGGGLGGGAANVQSTVQLPIIATTLISTTVTVPDGGTVLLGGVKRLTEQRLEYGTPVLSKIPTINRLFRNIGVGRTTDSLMLMVSPRIIILEEEEERLGIPAVPVPGLP